MYLIAFVQMANHFMKRVEIRQRPLIYYMFKPRSHQPSVPVLTCDFLLYERIRRVWSPDEELPLEQKDPWHLQAE
jgi:hypothetical protein